MTLVRSSRRLVLGLLAGSLAATSLLDAGSSVARAEDPGPGPVRAAAPATVAIVGPTVATLGRTTHLVATGSITEGAARYAWDLDGDGRYERSTGATRSVDLGFTEGGQHRVGVRVTGAGTGATATLAIRVRRPSVAAIQVSPPYAGPGDEVTLSMATRSDAGAFRAFTWKVEGVKPTRTLAGLRRLAHARAGGRAVAPPFAGPEADLSTAGTNLSVTTKPSLRIRLPSGKKKVGTTLDIVGTAIAPDGSIVTAVRRLKLDRRHRGVPVTPYPEDKVVDCEHMPPGVPSYPCAQMSTSGDMAAGIPVVFANSTPSVQACMPFKDFQAGGAAFDKIRIAEVRNLGYPAPEAFTLDGFNVQAGVAGHRVEARGVGKKEKCQEVTSETVSWSWGDGSTSAGKDVIGHAYAKPGTYSVSLTATVPYFKVKGQKLLTQVKYFTARTTRQVTIRAGYCGALSLSGFSVTTRKSSTLGCWVPYPASGEAGAPMLYRPQEGYSVSVGGIGVSGVDWVDPGAATLVGGPQGLTARMGGYAAGTSDVVAKQVLAGAPTLVLPAPTYDPVLGDAVTALPPAPVGPSSYFRAVKGLKVASAQAFISQTKAPRVVMALDLPEPLGDNTPPVIEVGVIPKVMGAPTGQHEREAPAGTDFSVDLTGTDLGAFRITEGGIHHRTTGGWIGGLDVDVDGLGELHAPYKPVPTAPPSDSCTTIDGPSGIEIDKSGGFVSGGAQATFAPQVAVGPLGLRCLAISGSSSPFVMSGRAQLVAPLDGPIYLDACLAASVLESGQTAAGCNASFTAPEDTVWFRASGKATLLGFLPLTEAELETRISKNYKSTTFGGSFDYDAGAFKLDADVSGTVVAQPQTAFDLIGSADLCQVNPIKNICFGVEAGVSSRGFGACASLGGFVYYWQGGLKLFFASCDLAARIGVQRGITRRAGGTVDDVTMPAGLTKAAFVVHRDDDTPGAPQVRLDLPGGGSIFDDGAAVQETPGYTIVKFPRQGVTSVTVTSPAGGAWKVNGLDGAITTELLTPDVVPVVTGVVSGTGNVRTLSYDATLAEGDSLVLTETGRSGTRVITETTASDASVGIPRAGSAGLRTVKAIVVRNGIPYRTITLGSYSAPAGARLATPAAVTAVAAGTGLRVSWPTVPGARGYDVQARTTTGRVVTQRVTGSSVVLSGLGRVAAGSVSVSAVGSGGTSSLSRSIPLRPVTTVRLRP